MTRLYWKWRTWAALILAMPAAAQEQTVYHGFTLLDPSREAVIENAYVVVDGERIVEVGSGPFPARDGAASVDMAGRYALPGFVDAHAHVTTGVRNVDTSGGAPIIRETRFDEITRFHALVALASGVTTIRNPAGEADANARYAEAVRSGSWLGPDALQAGPVMGPLPLEWAVHPPNEQAWRDEVERHAQLGLDYVKLYTGLTEEELRQGIEAAHAGRLRTIGHLDRVSWTRAAELGIDALTHALPTSEDLLIEPARSEYLAMSETPGAKFMYRWFELVDYDSAPMQEMIRVLAEKQVRVDLTLVVNELMYRFDEVDSLTAVKDGESIHPRLRDDWRQQLGASLRDWTDEDYRRARAVMPKVLELARRLHEAGVPLLVGTDGMGGGSFYVRELELHAAAGIPAWDVLGLATTEAAERLGIADRTGALEPGREADIVFLDRNPLEDVGNVKHVDAVVVDGRAYRRETLLALAAALAE